MLDMSKLPSHKIENGVVIFDEPCKIGKLTDLVSFMNKILDCDVLFTEEDSIYVIHAFASNFEANPALDEFLKLNKSKGWKSMYRISKNEVNIPV